MLDRQTVKISGEDSNKVNNFKYKGAVVDDNGGIEMEIRHISAAWGNWKKRSGVL